MTIFIEIYYFGQSHEIYRKGNFPVNRRKFDSDPAGAAAEVALNWIKDILREHFVSRVIRVTYNKENDITELVNK